MRFLRTVAAFAALTFVSACGSTRGDCNPTSCTGCCDVKGECQPGFLSDACGVNGAACQVCQVPTACGSGICLGGGGGGGGGSPDGGMTDGGMTDGGTTDAGVPTCSNITGDRQTQVCLRWSCDRMGLSEGTWTGSVASCTAGDNETNRQGALKLVNLYRFMAELPAVTLDASRNQQAQQCALMMHANGALSHMPPSTWNCYTSQGATAAGNSNIATAPGVSAVDLYMVDTGNATTLGHRRWILSPGLGPIGSGSTSQSSCLWVLGGTGAAMRPYVAWPPPGPFPMGAFAPPGGFGGSINQTGWSIQSSTINLSSAMVTVTDLTEGTTKPMSVTQLQQGYGSTYAIRMNPMNWAPVAGRSYQVLVTGVTTPFSYQVDVVSCP